MTTPKQLKKVIRKLKREKSYHKEMHQHYKELFEVAVNELRFHRLQEEYLHSVLEEISVVSTDTIIPHIIGNAEARCVIDRSIHNRNICKKCKE